MDALRNFRQASRARRRTLREAGVATIEAVGIAAAVVVLLGGVALGVSGRGGELGAAMQQRLQQAATGGAKTGATQGAATKGASTGTPARATRGATARATSAALPSTGSWRTWRERRWGGDGERKVHVPRADLRLAPALQPHAVWARDLSLAGAKGPAAGSMQLRACVLCAALEWSRDLQSGARKGSEGRFLGGEGSILGEARLALAAAEASADGTLKLGALTLDARGRARAMLGGEATLGATAKLSREVQALELEASAMAGASAKAEGRVGAALLGVAVEQAGAVEGWAGIGVRGTGALTRKGGKLSWRIGWGAALGLGGAAEWSGSIDVSKLGR